MFPVSKKEKKKQVSKKRRYADRKNMWHVMVIIAILLCFTIDRVEYVLSASANVPIMDYWRYIVQFVDKVFNEGVTLADLWVPQKGAAHRAIGMSIFFFLINVKWFGLNTQIEIALGAIATLINSLFVFRVYLKKMKWEGNIVKYGFLFIAMCMFNINQWEIAVLEFSLGFAMRILLTLIIFSCFDTMQREEPGKAKYIGCILFAFVVACLTGSYAPAILGGVAFVTIVQLVLNRKSDKRQFLRNVVIVMSLAIGIVLFFWGLDKGSGGSLSGGMLSMIKNGSLLRAVFYMLGSSILHFSSELVTQNGYEALLYVGIVLFALYMHAIYIFFKRKIYEKTYFPIMLMAYTACVILVISVGRVPIFDEYYVTASRYVVETTLGLCGVSWIYLCEIDYNVRRIKNKRTQKKSRRISRINVLLCCLGMGFIIWNFKISFKTEMDMAPYRKEYCQNLIDDMLSGEVITEKQAQNFQYEQEYVNEGIAIMKKYKLGVFKEQ